MTKNWLFSKNLLLIFFRLAGVQIPDPVFFCSIEPPSMSAQKSLDIALANLAREDPSLRIEVNEDANDQTILSGMGELHLEVLLKRIKVRKISSKLRFHGKTK